MSFTIPIIGELFTLARTWLQGKQKIQEATDNRKATIIQQEGTWDQVMAKASETSWKDEWLTILFSVPLILCFFPFAVSSVMEGFVALDAMPEWYRYTLSVIVAASFGVNKAIGMFKAKADVDAKKEASE